LPNTFLITASEDKSIIIWDFFNRKCISIIYDESIGLKALTNTLFASASSKKIKIWDYTKGKCIKTLNESQKYLARLEMTANNQIVSCMEDKTLSIMSLEPIEDAIQIKFLDG
jgi:WD40 repeat protein